MMRGRRQRLRVLAALTVALAGMAALAGCGGSAAGGSTAADLPTPASGHGSTGTAQVTFVELGSNSCIPCKEMRPVMEGIQKTFGDQVNVVFYDVWEDDAPAREYGISMIPTQVFLDEEGVEFHRHTGFYPQEKIEALLVEQGLEKVTTQ
jgi:thioredoxin 1